MEVSKETLYSRLLAEKTALQQVTQGCLVHAIHFNYVVRIVSIIKQVY